MNEETKPDRITELSERELDDVAGGGTSVDGIDIIVKKKKTQALDPQPPAPAQATA